MFGSTPPPHFLKQPLQVSPAQGPPGCQGGGGSAAANLRQQKEELAARAQVLQADVKSKQRGLILNRMQGLTRLAAAKLKAEEHDEQKKNLQREMIINRLRSGQGLPAVGVSGTVRVVVQGFFF